MSHMLRVYDEGLFQALKVEAARRGEALRTIVERVLRGGLQAMDPSDARDERQVTGEGQRHRTTEKKRVGVPAPRAGSAEAMCQRCGHAARKHTPACYSAGCVCRGADYREVEEA